MTAPPHCGKAGFWAEENEISTWDILHQPYQYHAQNYQKPSQYTMTMPGDDEYDEGEIDEGEYDQDEFYPHMHRDELPPFYRDDLPPLRAVKPDLGLDVFPPEESVDEQYGYEEEDLFQGLGDRDLFHDEDDGDSEVKKPKEAAVTSTPSAVDEGGKAHHDSDGQDRE